MLLSVRLLGKVETGKLRMGAGKLILLGEFRRMSWFEPLGRVRAVAKLVANRRRIRLTESILGGERWKGIWNPGTTPRERYPVGLILWGRIWLL